MRRRSIGKKRFLFFVDRETLSLSFSHSHIRSCCVTTNNRDLASILIYIGARASGRIIKSIEKENCPYRLLLLLLINVKIERIKGARSPLVHGHLDSQHPMARAMTVLMWTPLVKASISSHIITNASFTHAESSASIILGQLRNGLLYLFMSTFF